MPRELHPFLDSSLVKVRGVTGPLPRIRPLLLESLKVGALDAACVTTPPTSNTLQFRNLSEEPYALIGAAGAASPPVDGSLSELASWLNGQPWVSYSEERPITRRFWQQVLGSRFSAQSALVAPDLYAVVAAVELGIGLSIVPHYLARQSLEAGRIKEVWPLEGKVPPERRYVCFRKSETDSPAIVAIAKALD